MYINALVPDFMLPLRHYVIRFRHHLQPYSPSLQSITLSGRCPHRKIRHSLNLQQMIEQAPHFAHGLGIPCKRISQQLDDFRFQLRQIRHFLSNALAKVRKFWVKCWLQCGQWRLGAYSLKNGHYDTIRREIAQNMMEGESSGWMALFLSVLG